MSIGARCYILVYVLIRWGYCWSVIFTFLEHALTFYKTNVPQIYLAALPICLPRVFHLFTTCSPWVLHRSPLDLHVFPCNSSLESRVMPPSPPVPISSSLLSPYSPLPAFLPTPEVSSPPSTSRLSHLFPTYNNPQYSPCASTHM